MNDELEPRGRPSGSSGAANHPPPTWWRKALKVLLATGIFQPEEWPVRRMLGMALGLAVAVCVVAVVRHGVARVAPNQVGVLVRNYTGQLQLIDRAGYYFFLPYFSNFYVLDKSIQTLELSFAQAPGQQRRDMPLKTKDGSTVYLDVTISYQIDPARAVDVLQKSGQGARFATVWMEPFARHVCLATFGELTTEEMYNAEAFHAKSLLAQQRLREALEPHGLRVVAVSPGKFQFYPEYEKVIQEKKLADQQVEEQQAQARAAEDEQKRALVEAQKAAEAELAGFVLTCENRIMAASREALTIRRNADGYYHGTKLAADAELAKSREEAMGLRETLLAEAEGTRQMRESMAGEGGVNLVSMEWAKQLAKVRMTGTPITRDPHVQQLAVQPGHAAAGAHALPPAAPAAVRPTDMAGGTP